MSTFNWNAHPALRNALAFAFGIVISRFVAIDIALACMTLLLVVYASLRASINRGTGLPISLLIVLSATVLTKYEHGGESPSASGVKLDRVDCVGVIDEMPVVRGGQTEIVVDCDSILYRNAVAHSPGRIVVRVRDTITNRIRTLRAGDRISVLGALRSPRGPAIPGGFDERTVFSSRRLALAMSVADSRQVHRVSRAASDALTEAILYVREQMSTFARRHVGGDEGEIVEALLNGDRTGIDRETRDAFVATGTLHVLAVSGLHVAVFALALAAMTSWIPNRWIQLLFFVAVLGAYALIAGAGASIVRAWFMAGSFMLARVVGRQTRSLNVLAASALMLLILHPPDLYDVGFQLSFAAVAGIILFQSRLVAAFEQHCRVLNEQRIVAWTIRSLLLTVSAQLLTAPLLLVHFGALPAAGLLLNVVVVPLTSCALAAAAIGVMSMPMAFIPDWFGSTAYATTSLAIRIVEWGATIPLASIQSQHVHWTSAVVVISLAVWSSRAHRISTLAVRLGLTVVVCAATVIWTDRTDPVAGGRGQRVFLVPTGRASVVAIHSGDTLTIVGADSARDLRARTKIDALQRQLSPKQAVFVWLSSSDRSEGERATHVRSR
ncbi:MAG: ComEC/Rec2 family competence protein, partial [bacterium]|nr:ComEC/Rec2 family competence protein [Candidatus Kapabacteria bacterium]